MDWKNLLGIAKHAAKLGADVLKTAWETKANINIQTKGSSIDLVTQYDKASENEIIAYLKDITNFNVLGEETGGDVGDEYVWIIDPLDGTTNFSHGLPFFCVSVALVKHGRPLVGVVNLPALDMEFYAIKGQGAWLGGNVLKINDKKELDQSLIAFGCGYDRHEHPERYVPPFEAFLTRSQGMRRLGSAAIDCCFLANGWFDAYFEVNLKPWDLAAGSLILQESGCTVTDVNGKTFNLFSGRILAAVPSIHEKMLNVIKRNGLFKREF